MRCRNCSRIKYRRKFCFNKSISSDKKKTDNYLDSDGNRVNVGHFDSDGLNVNNNWDDNRNNNLGLSSARNSSFCLLIKNALLFRRAFHLII